MFSAAGMPQSSNMTFRLCRSEAVIGKLQHRRLRSGTPDKDKKYGLAKEH